VLEHIGAIVKTSRINLGLTQKELADLAGFADANAMALGATRNEMAEYGWATAKRAHHP